MNNDLDRLIDSMMADSPINGLLDDDDTMSFPKKRRRPAKMKTKNSVEYADNPDEHYD